MPSRPNEAGRDREVREEDRAEKRERRKHKTHRKKSSSKDDGSVQDHSSTVAASSPQKISMSIPELQRRSTTVDSPNASRTSLPYPTFSKAHSREAVGSKENIAPRKDIYTPDPTDLEDRKDGAAKERNNSAPAATAAPNAPPSPPLTANDQTTFIEEKRRKLEEQGEEVRRKMSHTKLNIEGPSRPASAQSSPLKKTRLADRSSSASLRTSSMPLKPGSKHAKVEDGSSVASKAKTRTPSPASSSRIDLRADTASRTNYSDRTSVASKQPTTQAPYTPDADNEASPTATESSTRTATPRGTPAPVSYTPVYGANSGYTSHNESPMPPPPPPPSMPIIAAPRVDYLMLHGGLHQDVPKQFLSAPEPPYPAVFTIGDLPNPTTVKTRVDRFFSPFKNLLDDYNKVMAESGSVAVATGYRSIARRLLDRLENVFARDISSETCACPMCDQFDDATAATEMGISWGEILEYVSGRQELPQWPPFDFAHEPVGLGISEVKAPMQKLDIDVPEEYREHYIRQSKKTKQSVDKWLAGQSNDSTDPPDEADDDTLTFAILTYLEPHERPIFSQLLGVAASRPPSIQPGSRAQTPLNAPRSELLNNTGLAVQRLYRLSNPPRSPECALFLLNNRPLHNVLATLAAVSDGEWDILTSGRFDGFLRSGADDGVAPTTSAPPSRGPSRGIPSRGPSRGPNTAPAISVAGSSGAPVAMDEETEIAALAEVERDIFLGMEALEDAFEALHSKAEGVRRALRERGAGLSMAAQARRGTAADVVEARLGTPASVKGWDSETDDGIDDNMSEIVPDDSASNVSSSRYRRPKRRTERRTPAPVEEESEEDGDREIRGQRHSWGRDSKKGSTRRR